MSWIALCFVCHEPLSHLERGLCSLCIERVLSHTHSLCPQCGLLTLTPQQLCQNCRVMPPPWERLLAVSDYTAPLRSFIHQVKYARQLLYIPMLARLLLLRYFAVQQHHPFEPPDIIFSAPLSARRLMQRGFNQAEQLAALLRHELKIPNRYRCSLKKIKHTVAQQGLNKAARQQNLQGSFQCHADLTGKKILLVDDVITTGHTVRELSLCLKQQGATQITLLCLCRAL